MIEPGVARPVRAVLFDLDGTLVDSLPTIAAAMSEAAALHGLHAAAEDIVPYIGAPMNVLVEDLFGVSPEIGRIVAADYLRIYHGSYIARTPPQPGAAALLDRLAGTGVRLAVVTNKRDEGAHLMVEVEGWRDRFEVVHGRESGAAKPDPEAAYAALRKMRIDASEAAFVGDTEFDMNCGRDAGLPFVIGLTGGRTAEHLRQHGATHVVDSLDEVGTILVGSGVRS